jgi:glycosyltransferase involved in cell wall biosynthesis
VLKGLARMRSGAFDVVNTHFVVPSGPVGHLLARAAGIPNVLSVHGGDLFDPSKASSPHRHAWLRTPIRYLLNAADEVVGQSRDTVRHVADIYRLARPVELIPLGIERPPPADAGDTRKRLGIAPDGFVMVTVGRLVARKSTVQLVQALAACARADAHLVVVGDGPDSAALRSAAANAGVEQRVHLLGHVSDEIKYQALAAADIFASTSQHEGFGLVFLEAMAFGLPVVCYDRGGQTDFLKSRETGHVARLNDLADFTRALTELHDQPALRREIGNNNRQRVEDFFIDRCAERYEALFAAQRERRASRVAK